MAYHLCGSTENMLAIMEKKIIAWWTMLSGIDAEIANKYKSGTLFTGTYSLKYELTSMTSRTSNR